MNAATQPVGSAPRPATDYRQLVLRGLAPAEAGNLTAVLAGLRTADQPWQVREINHLLFLRAMRDRGHFRREDGGR
jgi:hypothetical protein